jgi:G:T-mismatch repair DNA endonuclease (very short patch repair protein)
VSNPTKTAEQAKRTDREVLDDIEQRQTRVETRLSRLLEHFGLSFDGKPRPTPPRAYAATLPLDLKH